MTSWMISANSESYDHDQSFADNGYIDWVARVNYNIGDTVYIYYSKPVMQLRRACRVVMLHPDTSTITNDQMYWKNRAEYEKSRSHGAFVRLVPLDLLDTPISYQILLDNGMKQAPQKALNLDAHDKLKLKQAIEKRFENHQDKIAEKIVDEKTIRSIKSRRGQSEFRRNLLAKFHGRCCVSGCTITSVLEAAHIVPHSDITNYDPDNGLLLRADIHTLFDLGLIEISDKGIVSISTKLLGSEYEKYDNLMLSINLTKAMKENLISRLVQKST
ncbi:HNH endonuclease [Vibrio harveyi]|uniref:HNH endonuclease n=1 Tax=Vibrio harveyi TaxID=669 RepID=UPI000681FE0B|nr:HNH endonuclease [Vibrio harveyi]